MPAEFIHIHPQTPEPRKIQQVVSSLRDGGIVIYPTDTVYALGCDIHNARAVERIARIKGIKPHKNDFSFICHDLSHISDYARVSNAAFKVMKRLLPGPFTFILEANNKVPKVLANRKTVGIRVPDHPITRLIVFELDHPIITTSIKDDDEFMEYPTDPDIIFERFQHQVDIVIDGGFGGLIPSTVIDATDDHFEIIREGAGEFTL
ncbi:L-threonylcarbamoyladenylate synthase [Runella slithyformis]|uniref:Sua5/YciO/YrdC/YwlC family protein n=1 Tax=Runella slithyformis (strain ATCC 29530 / DSM 19594 / LMG 11500 / NCIMB 11436 / LSU 4) TaxID=761193 RepID=A0A7U3ZR15_RUNSL|nr:L-threonylcarbamoyladenylate synthase [Runella slithyformis]AEI51766.1 Sua5/YciO/YrdC/YwlC family protein [Runella slithyformis DSM 19594]